MGEKEFQIVTAKTLKNLDNKIWKYDIQPWVFIGGAGLILAGVFFTLIAGKAAEQLFAGIKDWITTYTGWFLVLTMNLVLATCVGIMVSPLGRLRIGGPTAEPEFSYPSWFAMLFSAGMGIGLLFYGVAEPMFHYVANPLSEPGTVAIDYTEWEFCHVIEGVAVLTNEAGRSWTVKAGDAFILPAGFRGTWRTVEPLAKHYVILLPQG